MNRDLTLIEEMGANYIRMAHYPHDLKELIQARDRGILLSEEIPYYSVGMGFTQWFEEGGRIRDLPLSISVWPISATQTLLQNAQLGLIEMVERDRNNPAVILWSVGNECYSLFDQAAKVFGWMRDVVRGFDPTRPVTMCEFTYDVKPFDDNRMTAKYMDVICVNAYYGWFYGEAEDMRDHLRRLHQRFPDKPIIISEFGADAALGRTDEEGVWDPREEEDGFAYGAYGKTHSEDYQVELYRRVLGDRPRGRVCGRDLPMDLLGLLPPQPVVREEPGSRLRAERGGHPGKGAQAGVSGAAELLQKQGNVRSPSERDRSSDSLRERTMWGTSATTHVSIVAGHLDHLLDRCDAPVVVDGHDDRVGQAAGVEGDPLVREDGRVHVEREGKDGFAERRDGSRNQAGEIVELVGGGKPDLLDAERPLELRGIEALGGADDEQDVAVGGLDDQGLAAHRKRLAADTSGILGGMRGLVGEVTIAGSVVFEEAQDGFQDGHLIFRMVGDEWRPHADLHGYQAGGTSGAQAIASSASPRSRSTGSKSSHSWGSTSNSMSG